MNERWRDTYDQWKLETPPEHDGEDESEEESSGFSDETLEMLEDAEHEDYFGE
jgi:hypothetical protein